MADPPFTLGVGASDYRRLTIESDPWATARRYVTRRDEVLSAYRLGGHVPVLWQVNVPSGGEFGGTTVAQLVRCEACGQWTPIPKRPHKRSRLFDPSGRRLDEDDTICVPVAASELRATVHRRHRNEKLWARGFVGAAFALLAVVTLVATLNAPAENRSIGYLGVLLWASVSTVAWISLRNVLRDERIRQEWEQRSKNSASNPTDDFISRRPNRDEDSG